MIVRQIAVKFDQCRKRASVRSIPFDEILSQLLKKLKRDTDFIAPSKYLFTDISEDIKVIEDNEKSINNAMKIMKKQQDDLAEFLVNLNSSRASENKNLI